MTTFGVVYGLHNGDGVIRYVGQTVDADRRLKQHRNSPGNKVGGTRRQPVTYWIRKHGAENIQMVILGTADTRESLDKLERELISSSTGLLNLAPGGLGISGYHQSEEHKKKLSDSQKGKSRESVCNFWHRDREVVTKDCPLWCAEQRAKGVPVTTTYQKSPSIGPHTRWHAQRGIVKEDCTYCAETTDMKELVS